MWCGSAVHSTSLHHTTITSLEYNQSQAMGLACCCCNQTWGQRGCLRVILSQFVQDKEGTGIAPPEVKLVTPWRKEPHVPPPRRPDVKFEDYSFVLSHPHMRVRVHV